MLREKVFKVVVSGGWAAGAEIFGLALRFFSLPILLAFYGRRDYGLIAIVISVQGYLGMLSLGTPDGLVKYAAEWLHRSNTRDLQLCARTTFTFYAVLGLLSGLILASLGAFCSGLFHIADDQQPILRNMFILAGVAGLLLSPTALLTQLLKAAEEFRFLSKRAIIVSALDIGWVLCAVHWHIRLDYFLAIRLFIPLLTLPALLRRWSRYGSLSGVIGFGWHWAAFRPIMNYGCSILAMGWAYNTFFQLRQVLLGARSSTSAVSEFSIILALTTVLTMAGKWIVGPLIPSMAKALVGGEGDYVNFVAYRMTKYFGLLLALPAVCIMVNADTLLTLYVGRQFASLAPSVALMMVCILDTFLAPLSGIIFAKGQLRPFVWSNGVLGLVALGLVWGLAPRWGSHAAVVATLAYYGANTLFHLAYYIPKVMNLDSWRLLREGYAGPVITAAITGGLMVGLKSVVGGANDWVRLGLTVGFGCFCYCVLAWVVALQRSERTLLVKPLAKLRHWVAPGSAVPLRPSGRTPEGRA